VGKAETLRECERGSEAQQQHEIVERPDAKDAPEIELADGDRPGSPRLLEKEIGHQEAAEREERHHGLGPEQPPERVSDRTRKAGEVLEDFDVIDQHDEGGEKAHAVQAGKVNRPVVRSRSVTRLHRHRGRPS
jgi:hypothetical protein